jgi:hypothetical protein
MGKPGGKRPFGRPRRRQEANIETCQKVIELQCVNGINVAQYIDKCFKTVNKLKPRGDKISYKIFLDWQ